MDRQVNLEPLDNLDLMEHLECKDLGERQGLMELLVRLDSQVYKVLEVILVLWGLQALTGKSGNPGCLVNLDQMVLKGLKVWQGSLALLVPLAPMETQVPKVYKGIQA